MTEEQNPIDKFCLLSAWEGELFDQFSKRIAWATDEFLSDCKDSIAVERARKARAVLVATVEKLDAYLKKQAATIQNSGENSENLPDGLFQR
jgi:hypothetical protein